MNMKANDLDYVLVPLGLALIAAYHLWLLYRIIYQPAKTVIGINAINRRIWVETIMEDPAKNGILAVQTLRNNIMASTLLATAAVMLSTLIVVLMSSNSSTSNSNSFLRGQALVLALFGNKSYHILPFKFFAIILCFMLAFFFNLQSIRYYSHGSMLIGVPIMRQRGLGAAYASIYVVRVLNKAGYFWSLGMHTFYFSIPVFLWLFGPVPMILSSSVLVATLYFLDSGNCMIGEGSGEAMNSMVNPE
ncbi:hypothetical protein LUZ62_016327 [Rhynchospora pubera]|uniref:DUF599 domain-containing protein n=1 Tax=Rhynchospora pubera TaxID=906938 RepID=A0AAV8GJY1_9POAL|nr:hypothetical protein LUZ62_016327 [Rhynchospora pubera]